MPESTARIATVATRYRRLQHGRTHSVLHCLREGEAASPALLLLHALGGQSADWMPAAGSWRGSVHALDFSGHGASDALLGHGYYPEFYLAEADHALAQIPGAAVALAGAGIGAYVALLLAGARRDRIPAALLVPGRGWDGCGAEPDADYEPMPSLEAWEACLESARRQFAPGTDPHVVRCELDRRPIEYAREFAVSARALLFAASPESYRRKGNEPPWWCVAREQAQATTVPGHAADALAALQSHLDASL